MKYTVETTRNGVNVCLQTKHGEFFMLYKRTEFGLSSDDKDFVDQIVDAGECDAEYLNDLDDMLADADMLFPLSILEFTDKWEWQR